MAQLVEHHLAKVRVAGSSPVIRSGAGQFDLDSAIASAVAWPRGEAAACKAVHTGSNPVATSTPQKKSNTTAEFTTPLGDWRSGSALP